MTMLHVIAVVPNILPAPIEPDRPQVIANTGTLLQDRFLFFKSFQALEGWNYSTSIHIKSSMKLKVKEMVWAAVEWSVDNYNCWTNSIDITKHKAIMNAKTSLSRDIIKCMINLTCSDRFFSCQAIYLTRCEHKISLVCWFSNMENLSSWLSFKFMLTELSTCHQ